MQLKTSVFNADMAQPTKLKFMDHGLGPPGLQHLALSMRDCIMILGVLPPLYLVL